MDASVTYREANQQPQDAVRFCWHGRDRRRAAAAAQPNPAWRGAHGLCVSASQPPGKPPSTSLRPTRCVCPTSPRTTRQRTGYDGSSLLLAACRHARRLTGGKVSRDDDHTTSFAPSTATGTEDQAQLSALRSLRGWRQLFSPILASPADSCQRDRRRAGRRHRLAAQRPQLQANRGSGHWTCGDRATKRSGWIHNDPTVGDHLVGGGDTSNLNGKGQPTTAPRTGSR